MKVVSVDHSRTRTLDNQSLKALIASKIHDEGPIGFDEYLRLALYHPVHGYYFACDPTLDYQSSPNVHAVFGAMLARQVADFWQALDRPPRFEIWEAAAGNLGLAADLLRGLQLEAPDLYDAVQYTAQDITLDESRLRQGIARLGLPEDRVRFAAELPQEPAIDGCIISNELLDALPFRRVRKRDGALYELKVGLDGESFIDVETEASIEVRDYFAALGIEPGDGCDAEVGLEARDWMTRAAKALSRGYVLTLDYGYEAPDLYAPWRRRGTLLTFHRHASDEDPYVRVGRQDITASVDFTTVRQAGERAGLRTYGSTTQGEFLGALGIGGLLSQPPAADELTAYYALRRAVIELTQPTGLGRIRALIQGKDAPVATPVGLQVATLPG